MNNSTCDIEIKKMDLKLIAYFEILCKKTETNIREEIINYMRNRVSDALEAGLISEEEMNNYSFEIEEY